METDSPIENKSVKKEKKSKKSDSDSEEFVKSRKKVKKMKVKEENPNAAANFRILEPLRNKLRGNGIEALFPIQAMTFDTILDGTDLVGRARTGQKYGEWIEREAYSAKMVTQSFIGHISPLDLAGYALVQTITVRFVNGILLGMSSATETLCGQAFGAGQYHMMGIYLQRS
ncbi:hypothetical protein ACET3Z_011784 [Daucus carota]